MPIQVKMMKRLLLTFSYLLLVNRLLAFQGSGNSLDFDGNNDYVSLAGAYNFGSLADFTIEFWVKTDGSQNDPAFISNQNWNSTFNVGFTIAQTNNTWRVVISDGSNRVNFVNIGNINDGKWHHLALVCDRNGNATVYQDGINSASASMASIGNIDSGNSIKFAQDGTGSYVDFFNGQMDEVKIWSSTRTQAQIRASMCSKVTGSEAGLLGYWRLDEASGSTVNDLSSIGNSGTILGGASRVVSGAPIGDISTNVYGGSSLSLTSTETVSLSNFVGSPVGIHLYKVTEAPNITVVPDAYSSLETSGYFGVFMVGETLPAYFDVLYTYTANTNVNGVANENEAEVAIRADNATTKWSGVTQTINTTTNEISIPKQNSRELIMGFKPDDYPVRPGSGFSLLFDGTNDYVEANEIAQHMTTNEFTLEAWIHPTSSTGDNVVSVFNTSTGGNSFEIGKQGNRFYVYTPTEGYTFTPTAIYPDNKWYHVAFTLTASATVSFYVNGILASSFPTTTDVNILDNRFSIGQEWDGNTPSDFFEGYIEEVRVWRKDMPQSIIRDWMCKTITTSHPEFDDLVGLFSFDEGVGAIAEDQISGVQGVINGTEQWRLSGAPIGDESAYTYGGSTITLVDTDAYTINNFAGAADGYHIYKVNQPPDITTPPSGVNSLETSRYFGVFPINGTNPTFDFSYDYTLNTNVNGIANEGDAIFLRRAQAGNIWNTMSHNQNAVTNTITAVNHIEGQYIIGWVNTAAPDPPGSGAALDFDGVNDYVSIANTNSFGSTTDFTIELWVKPNGSQNDPPFISDQNWNSTFNTGFTIAQTNSTWRVSVADGANRANMSNIGNINDGKWHHLALVCDRDGNATAYQDGINLASVSMASVGNINSGNTIKLGQDGTGGYADFFGGQIDEVRIWDVALSQTTIRDWMCRKVTNIHPEYANMLSYYNLNDGINTTAADIRNSNNATLNNFGLLAATSNWVTSSAPLGDESLYTYGGTNLTYAMAASGSMNVSVTSGTADLIHIYHIAEDPNVVILPGGYAEHDDNYWGVHTCGTGVVYTATYDYNTNTDVTDDSALIMAFRDDNSDPDWLDSGGMVDIVGNTITITGMTGTEYFLGGAMSGALPVTFRSFIGYEENAMHHLEWITSSEVNNDYFEIERSSDGKEFEVLAQIDGNGTTTGEHKYLYIDQLPLFGENYYRLKQVDIDGKSAYSSQIVFLNRTDVFSKISFNLYPNPTNQSNIKLNISSPDNSLDIVLSIYDLHGRRFHRQVIAAEKLNQELDIDINTAMRSGIYAVVVEQGGEVHQKKLLIE